MQTALRQQIREAIDARKRAQIARARGHEFACSGCGADRDARTVGCDPCSNRYYSRARRQNPERERRMQRARRRDNAML